MMQGDAAGSSSVSKIVETYRHAADDGASFPHLTNVHLFVRHVAQWLIHLGAFGPLLLGILDSSFLVFPFGNDLLVVVLTARNHDHLPFYVLTASLGSAGGVFLLDLVSRKGGEEGLKRLMSRSRLEYFKKKVGNRAVLSLSIASTCSAAFSVYSRGGNYERLSISPGAPVARYIGRAHDPFHCGQPARAVVRP